MREFISKYKGYVIIAVILIGYFIFSLVISGITISVTKHYIAVSDNVFWKYDKGKWYNMNLETFAGMDLSNFQVYNLNSGSLVGTYELNYRNKKWYTSSGKNDYNEYNDFLFAYRGEKKFKMAKLDYQTLNNDDYSIVEKVVKETGYSFSKNLNLAKKIVMDIDKDKKDETIYTISNMFSSENLKFNYSLVFIYKNNKYQLLGIDTYKYPSAMSNKKQFSIYSIIDLTGDGKYEIILANQPFSNPDETVYSMFQYQNNKFENVISSRQG